MLDIGGVEYFFDLEMLDKFITSKNNSEGNKIEKKTIQTLDGSGSVVKTEITTDEQERSREIDVAKYETVRTLIEIVLTTIEEIDDDLGVDRALSKSPLSFKISFNTLLNYGIIKEKQ